MTKINVKNPLTIFVTLILTLTLNIDITIEFL